jgi:hypothetical protein
LPSDKSSAEKLSLPQWRELSEVLGDHSIAKLAFHAEMGSDEIRETCMDFEEKKNEPFHYEKQENVEQ